MAPYLSGREFLRSANISPTPYSTARVFHCRSNPAWRAKWGPTDSGRTGSVPGVAGTWKDLTDSVIRWPATSRVNTKHRVSHNCRPPRRLSRKIKRRCRGEILVAQAALNTMVTVAVVASEVTRGARSRHGRPVGRSEAVLPGVAGNVELLEPIPVNAWRKPHGAVRNIAESRRAGLPAAICREKSP